MRDYGTQLCLMPSLLLCNYFLMCLLKLSLPFNYVLRRSIHRNLKNKELQRHKLLSSSLVTPIDFVNHPKLSPVEFLYYIFKNILVT